MVRTILPLFLLTLSVWAAAASEAGEGEGEGEGKGEAEVEFPPPPGPRPLEPPVPYSLYRKCVISVCKEGSLAHHPELSQWIREAPNRLRNTEVSWSDKLWQDPEVVFYDPLGREIERLAMLRITAQDMLSHFSRRGCPRNDAKPRRVINVAEARWEQNPPPEPEPGATIPEEEPVPEPESELILRRGRLLKRLASLRRAKNANKEEL